MNWLVIVFAIGLDGFGVENQLSSKEPPGIHDVFGICNRAAGDEGMEDSKARILDSGCCVIMTAVTNCIFRGVYSMGGIWSHDATWHFAHQCNVKVFHISTYRRAVGSKSTASTFHKCRLGLSIS
jgi:hypothetical protein